MTRNRGARPVTVPIVAAFLFGAAATATIVSAALIFPHTVLNRLWDLNKPAEAGFLALGRNTAAVLMLLLGITTLATAIGLLQRRKWAWRVATGLFVINGLGDLINFAVTRDWLRSASGVTVCAVFLVALSRPRMLHYFAYLTVHCSGATSDNASGL